MLSDEAVRIAYSTSITRDEKIRRLKRIADAGDRQVKLQVAAYFRSFAMSDDAAKRRTTVSDTGENTASTQLTDREQQAFALAERLLAAGRQSVSATFVGQQLGWSATSAAAVLRNLEEKGYLRGFEQGFVGNKRWVYVLADPR